MGGAAVIVVGIDTATPQTSVAIGDGSKTIASTSLATGKPSHDLVSVLLQEQLERTGLELESIAGVAVGVGPGLFTGLRVGVETAKTLAQVIPVPIVALPSLDVLAFGYRYSRRAVAAVIDARRGEVFFALYKPVPGGLTRVSDYLVGPPDHLVAELEAFGQEVLLVGNGAILYRRDLEVPGAQAEVASAGSGFPEASSLVELAIPRFLREEHDRLYDVAPMYLRKSDAEIAWGSRARSG
jgi:tRNA threonylcarbamoyladenosine biosynthesis protein TsaB